MYRTILHFILSLSLAFLPAVPAFAQYNQSEQSLLQDLIEFAQTLKEQSRETAAIQKDISEDTTETTKEINKATGRTPGISAITVEEEKHDIEKANELTSFVGGINGVLSYIIDEVAPPSKETVIEQLESEVKPKAENEIQTEDRKPSEEPVEKKKEEIAPTDYDKADYILAAYHTSNTPILAPKPYLDFFEATAGERFSSNDIKPIIETKKQKITIEEAKEHPSVQQLQTKIQNAEQEVLNPSLDAKQRKKSLESLLDILEADEPRVQRREVAPSEISIQPRDPITVAEETLKNESLYRFFNDAEFSFLRDEYPNLYYGKAFNTVQKKLDTIDNPESHLQLMNAVQHVHNEVRATEPEVGEAEKPKRKPLRVERFIEKDIDKRQTQILGEVLNLAAILDADMITGLINNDQSEKALIQLKKADTKLRTNIAALRLMRKQGNRALISRLQHRELSDADRIAVLEVLAERMDQDVYDPSEEDLNIIKLAIDQFKEKVKRELGQERMERAICEYQKIIEQHNGVVSTLAKNSQSIRLALANENGEDHGFAIQMANLRQILLDRIERIIEAAKDKNDSVSQEIKKTCESCKLQILQFSDISGEQAK